MADLTPAATLRAAATLIRETASKATPGPWMVSRIPGIGRTVNDPTARLSIAVGTGWVSGADGEWIALMHPGLAEHLAAWLDGVAKDIDGHDPDGGCECTESDSYHRAMDFAAAILGRQS